MPDPRPPRYFRCTNEGCARKWHALSMGKRAGVPDDLLSPAVHIEKDRCPSCGGPCVGEPGTFEELFYNTETYRLALEDGGITLPPKK